MSFQRRGWGVHVVAAEPERIAGRNHQSQGFCENAGAPGATLPWLGRRRGWPRSRTGTGDRGHTVAAEPKTVALTSGATGPPSSNETSAPGTWLTEVPR